jgi:hypothetical protein
MPSSRARRRAYGHRLFVADLLDRVDQRQVQHLGHEARADALDLVAGRLERLAGAGLREHRAGAGSTATEVMALPLGA